MQTDKPVIILGAGGHASVIADIVLQNNLMLKGYLDDSVKAGDMVLGHPVLGPICDAVRYSDCRFMIGIGNNKIRKQIAEQYDLDYISVRHPRAIIGLEASIGIGTVIMAGAVINPNTTIGTHAIINTGATVDHDNVIGDYVHISPGASLGGTARIEDGVHIGIGAVISNNVVVHRYSIVGAGAVAVSNIPANCTAVGCPAKPIKFFE